ncbi:mechanosensitive ion channel family protein [Fusibacter tunisiensis]|uniref:Small conductance mechanosensitive channel n=1 Tax=Fusibacter tunisiensis TaxID=1008308 RepID=A0ABS2MUG7_9FIRM|nr:mechanosensitive ion channel domain-containing protein [Fusibacter tunisiensis]MBM7563039.1 small conductance mechanosensitive channel [Fusibacter tunisiensis]
MFDFIGGEVFSATFRVIVMQFGLKLILALLTLVIGFKLANFIEGRLEKTKSWMKVDDTLQIFLGSVVQIGFKALVVITAILIAGVPMATFVTILGAAGLAIGLALQGSLSNLAGGVLIIALRPFKVGDYIDGAGFSGTVTEIGLFYTKMKTVDNRAIVIPNSSISGDSIVNYGFYSTRRLDLDFGVDYGSNIEHVKNTILEVINAHPLVIKDPEPFVRLGTHADSALIFKTRVWVSTADYWTLNFDLQEQVKEALDSNGIDIPYPHMVIQQK